MVKLSRRVAKKVFGYPSPNGNFLQQHGTHKVRQIFFMELADQNKSYYTKHQVLSRYISLDDRMDSLYYDTLHDQLPHEIYNLSFAAGIILQVRIFAHAVWKEIR